MNSHCNEKIATAIPWPGGSCFEALKFAGTISGNHCTGHFVAKKEACKNI